MKVKINRGYSNARALEYPTVLEFIEATTEKELGDTTKWDKYLTKVQEVRERHPKSPPVKPLDPKPKPKTK
jgi:hypothetical protein